MIEILDQIQTKVERSQVDQKDNFVPLPDAYWAELCRVFGGEEKVPHPRDFYQIRPDWSPTHPERFTEDGREET